MSSPKLFSRRNVCILLTLCVAASAVAQGDPNEVQKLLASDGKAGDDFGRSVVVQDSIAFVGAPRVDVGANTDQGQVYMYEFMPDEQWVEVGVLRASDGAASDVFGFKLALDGDWLAVNAFGTDNYTGSVYLFQRQENGEWIEKQEIKPTNGEQYDYFGIGLDLWQDRMIVGASGHGVDGSAYIYELIDGIWTEVAFLLPDEHESFSSDLFGGAVAIAGDLALVGAQGDDDAAANAGAVYVYERVESEEVNSEASHISTMHFPVGLKNRISWSRSVKTTPADLGFWNNGGPAEYGGSVWATNPYVSGQGYHFYTGAPGAPNQNDPYVGAVIQSSFTVGGKLESKLVLYAGTGPNAEAGKSLASAVRDDGSVIVVTGSGSVESGGGAGIITLQDEEIVNTVDVIGSDTMPGDDLGRAVATTFKADGNADVFVSAPGHDGNGEDAGAVYVFKHPLPAVSQGDTDEVQKLLASDGKASDDFGRSVVAQDNLAFVGAPGVNIGANTDQGQVYMYEFMPDEQWVEAGALRAADGDASDQLGYRLALDGDWLAVTAFSNESGGSVYMFQRQENGEWTEQQEIKPSQGRAFDRFGIGLDLWQDRLIVGASGDSDKGILAGSAYIYELIDETWTEVAFLLPDELGIFDLFGEDVAILGDYVLVGAPGDDDAGSDAGAVFFYLRQEKDNDEESDVFNEKRVFYSEYTLNSDSTRFGNMVGTIDFGRIPSSVGVDDPLFWVVGAPGTDNQAENGGAVELWSTKTGGAGGELEFQEAIYAGTEPNAEAGKSLASAARDDGSVIVVTGSGAEESGGGAGIITLQNGEIVNTIDVIGSDTMPGDDLGRAVATTFKADGNADVFVSAPGHDGNGEDSGAVYVFYVSVRQSED